MDQTCKDDKTCLPQEEQPDPADSFNRLLDTIAIHGNRAVILGKLLNFVKESGN
jgi:hypothetical protein